MLICSNQQKEGIMARPKKVVEEDEDEDLELDSDDDDEDSDE